MVTGLLAGSVLSLAGVANAADTVNLVVSPGGVKKAEATWDAWQPGTSFDAYWVTADDDSTNGPWDADRGRFVDDTATRSVLFDDLSSGTTYYFNVYAIDYTDAGPVDFGGGPIGTEVAAGSTLTINATKETILAGGAVTLYGSLTGGSGSINVQRDPYPYNGAWVDTTVATSGTGQWTQAFTPKVNTHYRALYEPNQGIGGWTRTVTVEVREKITVQANPGTTVSAGTQIKYSGKVSAGVNTSFLQPPVSGSEPVPFCLQRLSGGNWSTIKCVPVNNDGTYLITHSPGADQDGKYRVFSGMGPAYADSWSRSLGIRVN